MSTVLLSRNDTLVDKQWIQAALRNRYGIKIYEYNQLHNATTIKTLKGGGSMAALDHRIDKNDRAKNAILRASGHLNVDFPGAEGALKRDYYLAKDADSIYFVGEFSMGRERLQVKGDVAWVVEMFFDELMERYESLGERPNRFPIYMFCDLGSFKKSSIAKQFSGGVWCQLTICESKKDITKKEFRWLQIRGVPRPTGNFVGLGSTSISKEAKTEIRLV